MTIGMDICEALGLDPGTIGSLSIKLDAQDVNVARVDVHHTFMGDGLTPAMVDVLRRYKLTEKPWSPPLPPPKAGDPYWRIPPP